MPVAENIKPSPIPEVHHLLLETTFCGTEHSSSTPETPVHQYLGIKYATIPARFRQSKLLTAYPPVVDASKHGPICPQIKAQNTVEEVLLGIPVEEIPKQVLKQDEFECLNLNITCPGDLNTQSRVPVMVWIHGGGDRGSGSQWIYDGGSIVRKSIAVGKPVILVTLNFRLGLFGFAASPLLLEDNKAYGDEGVGNYGLRDQYNAMKWLHNYIADFGGDPSNITLFGESTGAGDVVCHLLSTVNEKRPLFHRAIVQSGLFETNMPDVPSAGAHLSRISSALRILTVEQLRSVEPEKLVALGQSMRAVDDGVFFISTWRDCFKVEAVQSKHQHAEHKPALRAARSPSVARSIRSASIARSPSVARSSSLLRPHSKARSRSALRSSSRFPSRLQIQLPSCQQPLIIGDCSCDSLMWSLPISMWTPAGVVRRIKAVCQSLSKANNLMRAYDISSYTPDEEIYERLLELVNDALVAWPTECVAINAKLERGGRGVWRYVFDQEGPSRGVPHHAADLGYLFDNVPLPKSAYTAGTEGDTFFDGPFDDLSDEEDSGENIKYESVIRDDDGDDQWNVPVVDEWTYTRVKDTMQERWIAFANGEVPWREDKVFVFGPEGETGERSTGIFEGRRRRQIWKQTFENVGLQLVQKLGVELSRGPPFNSDMARF